MKNTNLKTSIFILLLICFSNKMLAINTVHINNTFNKDTLIEIPSNINHFFPLMVGVWWLSLIEAPPTTILLHKYCCFFEYKRKFSNFVNFVSL